MGTLAGLFDPERIAVVGATDREGSVGRALLSNLSSFPGEVIPVNPNRERVLGRRCYPEVGAVPNPSTIDLAVVAVPVEAVVEVVRQLGVAGIRNVIVITAGFRESGDRGRQRERALVDVADEYGLNLVGPNCVGVINTSKPLNATFARGRPPEGTISLMSQSGAFIAAILGWAAQHGVGLRHVVSLGNEAVLDEIDFIDEWGDDPETEVILAYLEDIDDGRRFIETARRVTSHTPIVAIKSGRTQAGAAAAASHTGSIAGSDEAYRAGLHQAGALRALTIQEAFDSCQALAGQPLPDRDEVAVVTNGGGPGVLAADAVGESRLSLAAFDDDVMAAIAPLLPQEAEVSNPLDIIGDADLDRFRETLDVVLGAETVGGAVVVCIPTALLEFEDLAEVIVDLHRSHGKPVLACLMGGEDADRAADRLAAAGIPNYFDPARAVASLAALAEYREVQSRAVDPPVEFDVDRERAEAILAEATGRGDDYLGVEAMELLDAYGIPRPAGDLAASVDDAEHIAASIDGPVVMKIVSPDIVHKSDIGGVDVGVHHEDVRDTYRRLVERARAHDPDAAILGVHVEELVELDESTETIVGATRDPQFDHLVMFGLGGIFVQIFEDTSFRVAPVGKQEATDMITGIRAAPMLQGARGRTPADLDAVAETIQRISQLVTEFPEIRELDVNPLVVAPEGVCAVDLRLTVDGGSSRPSP